MLSENKVRKGAIRLWFADFWRPATEKYIRRNSLYRLLSRHWEVILSPQDPDFLLYSCNGIDHLKYPCLRIFFAGENVRPDYSHCDYAFSFDYPVTERNYRLPLYRLYDEYGLLFRPRDTERVISENRKFCCFLVSNKKAQERIEFFRLLSRYKPVDSGGKVLNNIGGPVEDKMSWMRNYKFSIVFENSQYPGYTTEKLPHALVADTVPIYWGNPVVGLDFNSKAFVNCADYRSFDDVVDVVREIDRSETLYREYLNRPYLPGNAENPDLREESIIAKFASIFAEKRTYVPESVKARQRREHRRLRLERRLLRVLRR